METLTDTLQPGQKHYSTFHLQDQGSWKKNYTQDDGAGKKEERPLPYRTNRFGGKENCTR